jgi:3-hydroxybutyryl-CoA dehydrogenase
MGSGIALACVLGGKHVRVLDFDIGALEYSRRAVAEKWRFMADKALVSEESERLLDDIAYFPATELDAAAAGVDLCFEALPDDLQLKRTFIARLLATLESPAPVATNSGNLLVDDIVAQIRERGRVLSAHWINPPHIMPVVEVSPGTDTDPKAVQVTRRCLEELGKRPVLLARDIPGRIANRLHFALLNEAIRLLQDGVASAEDIDMVARYTFVLRHALFGPLGAQDLYGRKAASLHILTYLHEATADPVYAPTPLHREKAALEQAGQKQASHWRQSGLPDKLRGDERIVDLMKFLASQENAGR